MKIKTRYYASVSPLEVPLGVRGAGRMRKHGILWCIVAQRSPDAARNATGATFAWGPFRPLDFSGPRTPPECEAPPEDHSQLMLCHGDQPAGK